MSGPEDHLGLEPGVPTKRVPCPACLAAPGAPCTAPDDRSRHAVGWLHYDRVPRESYPSRYGFGDPDPGEGFGPQLDAIATPGPYGWNPSPEHIARVDAETARQREQAARRRARRSW